MITVRVAGTIVATVEVETGGGAIAMDAPSPSIEAVAMPTARTRLA
jgi:hypothetical protein